MKKKTFVGILALSALAVGGIATAGFISNNLKLHYTNADDGLTLNAFASLKANPSATVELTTTRDNKVNMTTSGLSVNGEKLVIAAGGYLEVARDESHPFKNGIGGLTTLTTDFVGRIEYSYPDQLYVVDDAVSGNYTFPTEAKPSYFKLYNDGETAVEITSLSIDYTCVETSLSVVKGAGDFTLASGVVTSTQANTTFTIPLEATKAKISYSLAIPSNDSSAFGGVVVGLNYQSEKWWETTETDKPSYMFSAIGGDGKGTFAAIGPDTAWTWCDNLSHRPISSFLETEFNDFEVRFDTAQNRYSLHHGNQIVAAADTDKTISGNKFGVRFGNVAGMQIKNIKVTLNSEFATVMPNSFTNGSFHVYESEGKNVYECTTNNAVMWWKQQLPAIGTITYDYSANGPCTFYGEGLAFTSDLAADKTGSGDYTVAIIGTGKTNNADGFYASGRYYNGTKYAQGYFDTNPILPYASDGTTLHIKIDYDLDAASFAVSMRDSVDDAWDLKATYVSATAKKSFVGTKYLGIRAGYTHNNTDGVFTLTISNLVVNGVAW